MKGELIKRMARKMVILAALLFAQGAGAHVLAQRRLGAVRARHPTPACGLLDLVMPGASGYVDPLAPKGLEMYGGQMTSRVWYSAPKADDWSKVVLMLPHEAVRHELLRLERLAPKLQYRQPGDPSLEAISDYYTKYVEAAVLHLHACEDEVLFPAIRAAGLEVPSDVAQRLSVAATAFREAQAWSDADLQATRVAITSGNGLLASKSFGPLSERVGNLMEQKERLLAGLLAENLTKEWADEYTAKVDEWSAGRPFSDTFRVMVQMAASASKLEQCLTTTISDDALTAVNGPKTALLQRCIGSDN